MWIYSNAFFCFCFCCNKLNCLLQSFSKLHKTLQWGSLLENLVLLIFKLGLQFLFFFFFFFFLRSTFCIISGEFEWMVYSIEKFFCRNDTLQFCDFQSSWENKIPRKKTGRKKSFWNNKGIFFLAMTFFCILTSDSKLIALMS